MHPSATETASAATGGRELSVGQEALWYLYRLAPRSSAYNVSAAVSLHFPVDRATFMSAVRRTVSRNSVLNSVFRSVAGEVRRYPGGTPEVERALGVHELSTADHGVREFARELAQQPFRLDQELPVRVALLCRKAVPDVLLVAGHHIAMDNVSLLLILREILDEYAAIRTAGERAVADTGAGFDRFVSREREFLGSPRAASARSYWRRELRSVGEGAGLPTDRPRPAVYTFAGSQIDVELPRDLMARVEAASAAQEATPFAYLLSVFQLLLYAWSGETDFLIGYPVTVRPGRAFRESIGYFVNTLPFAARIDPDDSVSALVRRTSQKLWGGLLHRDYPFALMPQLIDARRDPSRAGLISMMFVMAADDPADPFFELIVPGRRVEHAGLAISEFDVPQQLGQFDLTLQVLRHGTAAPGRLKLKYNTSLLTAETARRLAEGYVELLRSACAGALPARLREIGNRPVQLSGSDG